MADAAAVGISNSAADKEAKLDDKNMEMVKKLLLRKNRAKNFQKSQKFDLDDQGWSLAWK